MYNSLMLFQVEILLETPLTFAALVRAEEISSLELEFSHCLSLVFADPLLIMLEILSQSKEM